MIGGVKKCIFAIDKKGNIDIDDKQQNFQVFFVSLKNSCIIAVRNSWEQPTQASARGRLFSAVYLYGIAVLLSVLVIE